MDLLGVFKLGKKNPISNLDTELEVHEIVCKRKEWDYSPSTPNQSLVYLV